MKSKKTANDIQSGIETIRNIPGVPEWLLDAANYAGSKPVSEEEMFEFAEFHTKQLRSNAALYYLNSCIERFGFNDNGIQVFRAPGLVIEIDQNVIETLLIHQIERYLIEDKPEDRYLTPMRFYMGDEVNRKENGSAWLTDFIDSVFVEGAKEIDGMFSDNISSTVH